MPRRRIAFVIFAGFQPLDLVGPHQVFQHASALTGEYDCEIVAPQAGLVRSASGLLVHASGGVAAVDPAGIDTLVVAGGRGLDHARLDSALTGWMPGGPGGSHRCAAGCSSWRPRAC